MNEENVYKIIEELYNEKRDVISSKEFNIGKKILRLKYDLTHFKIKDIFKRTINNINTIRYAKELKIDTKNGQLYPIYNGNKKIVIYTCITGDYDNVCEPVIKEKKCNYFLYTNNKKIKSNNYEIKLIPKDIQEQYANNIIVNRYIKMHPYELFENEYDYAIYIDGNIRVISNISSFINFISPDVGISMHKHSSRNDIYKEEKILKILRKGNKKKIKKQMDKYREEGFPNNYGMAEANVIVTDLKNDKGKKIFDSWWNEFIDSHSLRDQLSLPYVLWKNRVKVEKLTTLGNNVFDNPKIEVVVHK